MAIYPLHCKKKKKNPIRENIDFYDERTMIMEMYYCFMVVGLVLRNILYYSLVIYLFKRSAIVSTVTH